MCDSSFRVFVRARPERRRIGKTSPAFRSRSDKQGLCKVSGRGEEAPFLGLREAFAAETPLGELPAVEDVTEAVLFLASDAARFVSGENIHVDGGGATRRLPRADDIVRAMQAAAAK